MPTLTTAEVAKLLNVTPRWARALRDRIGNYEVRGGALFFDERAVKRFMEKRKGKK